MENFIFDDGGRKLAGYKGSAGDCGARALAIAEAIPYKKAYKMLANANKAHGLKNSARDGVSKEVFAEVLKKLGYEWQSAPKFDGRKARCADLDGTVIASQAGHYVAVENGVPRDTWDCSKKMVYGYFKKIDRPFEAKEYDDNIDMNIKQLSRFADNLKRAVERLNQAHEADKAEPTQETQAEIWQAENAFDDAQCDVVKFAGYISQAANRI